MVPFSVGQKWVSLKKLRGVVTEISDEGASGVVEITDAAGQPVDTYEGTAREFQRGQYWQPAE